MDEQGRAIGTAARYRRVAILAGGGDLPILIAESVTRRGGEVHLVGITGEADPVTLARFPHTFVNFAEAGKIFAALKGAPDAPQPNVMVIAGKVKRPVLTQLRPDRGFLRILSKALRFVTAGGDDALLTRIIRVFEEEGLIVVGVQDVAPELLLGAGRIAGLEPDTQAHADLAQGLATIAALGDLDVGQAVVVGAGRVLAIEGVEGTDVMLARLVDLNAPPGAVLVKAPKPRQERRVDLPTIGVLTVEAARRAGVRGIAVVADAAIGLQREEMVKAADASGVFVVGVPAGAVASDLPPPTLELTKIGRVKLGPRDRRDAEVAVRAVTRLADDGIGSACAVVRRHVLGIAAMEAPRDFARRLSPLIQWGGLARLTRRGMFGVRVDDHDDAIALQRLLADVAATGLAGLVVVRPANVMISEVIVQAADREQLIMVEAVGPARRALPAPAVHAASAPLTIAIVSGEHSGDALGGKLLAQLRADAGTPVHVLGVGGDHMAAEGLETLFPLSDVAVMGIGAIASALPKLTNRVYRTVDAVVTARPDALVIIDSPEFTHPIAKRVRKRRPDIPIIDYVSPSVWAWRPGRARVMRDYVDHVLALLPFEPEAHARLHGPPCTYVGHPLIEQRAWIAARDVSAFRAGLQLAPGQRLLVVLPGSRRSEVSRMMAPFGDALRALGSRGMTPKVVIPVVPHVRALIEAGIAAWPVVPTLIQGDEAKWSAFRAADAALAASGTVTLELGLAGCPMVVGYRIDRVTAAVVRPLISASSIVLANLVLGRNVVPEFTQADCNGETLAAHVAPLLSDTSERAAQIAALAGIPVQLSLPSGTPSEAAARVVLDLARRGRV